MAEGLQFSAPDFGSNPIEYIKQARIELKKVQWPTREQVIRSTVLVFAVSVIIGAFLGGLDYGYTKLFSWLLNQN